MSRMPNRPAYSSLQYTKLALATASLLAFAPGCDPILGSPVTGDDASTPAGGGDDGGTLTGGDGGVTGGDPTDRGPAGVLAKVNPTQVQACAASPLPWTPLVCSGPTAAGPAVICVDGAASVATPAGTSDAPYHDVLAAAAAAKDGDSILVAAGTYTGNLPVTMGRGLSLYGGFPGGGNFQCRSASLFVTTLASAPNGGSILAFYNAPKVTIDGFTITGGTGNFDGSNYKGGGIYVNADPGTPAIVQIANNTIQGNNVVHDTSHETRGGAIYLDTVGGVVENNLIQKNNGGRGGGIAWAPALNGIIRNNRIIGNTSATSANEGHPVAAGIYMAGTAALAGNYIASNLCSTAADFGWGGGVYGFQGTFTMTGDTITDNFAPNQGSGVFFEQTVTVTLDHELFYANRCPMRGGAAVYLDQNASGSPPGPTVVTLQSSTIVNHVCNAATEGGNAIFAEGGSTMNVKNSVIWNNGSTDFFVRPGTGTTLNVAYTLSHDVYAGTGNIQLDPLFANPAAFDFSLKSVTGRWDPAQSAWVKDAVSSPAIDKGDPLAPFGTEPSPNGGRLNLGHQGNTAFASKSP